MTVKNIYCEECMGEGECFCEQEGRILFEVVGAPDIGKHSIPGQKPHAIVFSAGRGHRRCHRQRAHRRERHVLCRPRPCKAK